MIPPFWDRVREWVCRHFGHREQYSQNSRGASCTRCGRLLWTDYERGLR